VDPLSRSVYSDSRYSINTIARHHSKIETTTPPTPLLLAAPNVSEGRDSGAVRAIGRAFTGAGGVARLLDVHADPDHHRAVFTLAGRPGSLAQALAQGAAEAIERVDVASDERAGSDRSTRAGRHRRSQLGQHPHVGAVDVVPVVYLDAGMRGAACAEALVAAHLIGEGLGVPVFLYGELSGADPGTARTRAELRRGGRDGLRRRLDSGELRPDFGPPRMHPTAGATLVAARPPLVAFNLELAPPATVQDARRIASLIREGGAEGLEGVRAIGVALRREPAVGGGETAGREDGDGAIGPAELPTAQVSTNVERPSEVPLRRVVEAVRRHAVTACGELVGLAPAAALEDFPEDLPLPGFDPARHVIEKALGL
jgi:glutamate formiminotransferase / 5-formyltetrahydrofolate cyclo-ligase